MQAHRLSDAAFRTHIEGLCWVVRYRTGGFVANDELRRVTGRTDRITAVAELITQDWWASRPGGWVIVRDMPAQKPPGRQTSQSPPGWAAASGGASPWVRPADYPFAAAVYRFFGDRSVLLYVGVADDPAERFRGHRRTPWWPLVRYVEIEWFAYRSITEHEERRAIYEESPQFNRKGTTGAVQYHQVMSPPVPVAERVRVYRLGGD